MCVSAAANKPWKRAAMKTIPKLCPSVFFFRFHFPSLSSDGSSVAAAPALGATRRRLTGVFVARDFCEKAQRTPAKCCNFLGK